MKVRHHLTYANVTATLALVLALGTGVVYAAGEIGSWQIANNSVRTQDLKDRRGVEGEDVRRNSLGASEIEEASLVGSRIIDLQGAEGPDCNPIAAVWADCVSESLELATSSQLMVTVTGGFYSQADDAHVECEVRIDEADASLSDAPGEVMDNTSPLHADGFARTLVTGSLTPGTHTVALACQQLGAPDARIRAPTIAIIAITTD